VFDKVYLVEGIMSLYLRNIVEFGQLNVLNYLVNNGLRLTVDILDWAVISKKIEVIEYIIKLGVKADVKVLYWASFHSPEVFQRILSCLGDVTASKSVHRKLLKSQLQQIEEIYHDRFNA